MKDYHDSLIGLDHRYERDVFDPDRYFCSIHQIVCNPFYTVTPAMIRDHAARDPELSDGAYVVLSQVLREQS